MRFVGSDVVAAKYISFEIINHNHGCCRIAILILEYINISYIFSMQRKLYIWNLIFAP